MRTERVIIHIVTASVILGGLFVLGFADLVEGGGREEASIGLVVLYGLGIAWAGIHLFFRAPLWVSLTSTIFAAVTLGFVFLAGAAGWFVGEGSWEGGAHFQLDAAVPQYCESYTGGFIQQPISTWTSLAWIVSGLAMLIVTSLRTSERQKSAVRDPPVLDLASGVPLAYAMVVIFMGPGAMYLHASMKQWGGVLDWFSVTLWGIFAALYGIWRSIRQLRWARNGRLDDAVDNLEWPRWVFMVAASVLGIASLVIGIVGAGEGWKEAWRIPWLATMGVMLVVFWIAVAARRGHNYLPTGIWTLIAACTAGLAFAAWGTSGGLEVDQADPPMWCAMDRAGQGHGVWHIFSALLTYMLFMVWQTEPRGTTSQERRQSGGGAGDPGEPEPEFVA